MNPHVKRFFLIFCLIGVAVCAFLAVVNASQSPAATRAAMVFAVAGLVMAAGAVSLRSRREI